MAITIDGKIYRNLQEQVLFLTDQFNELKPTDYQGGSGITVDGSTISADSTIQRKPETIHYPYGGPTSLTYDTTDGLTMEGNARLETNQGTQDVPLTSRIPIKPGSNITIDTDAAGEFVIISADGSKIDTVEIDASSIAHGRISDANTIAKLTDPSTIMLIKEISGGYSNYVVAKMVYQVYDTNSQRYNHFEYAADTKTKHYSVFIDHGSDIEPMIWALDTKAKVEVQYINLTVPASSTQGTITADQLLVLQASDQNYIVINDTEIYLLQDKGHTNGIWTYTHEGYEGGGKSKYLNLTIATRAYTIVESDIGGGTKVYEATVPGDDGSWVQVGDDNTNVLTVNGLKDTDVIILDLALDASSDAPTAIADYANLTWVQATTNTLTIHSLAIPTAAYNIRILVLG